MPHPRRYWPVMLTSATAVALLVASAAARAAPLERTLVAGATETVGSRLADVPFSSARGHGHVRGWLQRREDAVLFGGEADLPAIWREGVEKYVFRLPSGRYRVELTFLETDVATPGQRVFDVRAEGGELFPGVDIVARAGDFRWLTLTGIVAVRDGWLDLEFVRRQNSRPPRVSRVRVVGVEDAGGAVQRSTPRLRGIGGPGCAILQWGSAAPGAEVSPGRGPFAVYRSDTAGGSGERIVGDWYATEYIDHAAEPGKTYWYSVRTSSPAPAGGATGEGSSAAVAVEIRRPEDFGLPVYSFAVAPDALARMSERRVDALRAPAVLSYLGKDYQVQLSYDTNGDRWQRKKSLMVWLDPEHNRFFFDRRRKLYLSAEAGEPTLLRELLCAAARERIGLTVPRVQPVLVFVAGRFAGVYLDREKIGTRFRKRTPLEDRSGLLTVPKRGDRFRGDWQPYGRQVGEPGNLISWTRFVHELDRVGTAEVEDWFAERLYLDRFVARRALAAVEGGESVPLTERYFLEDSRNRRWESLAQEHRSGQWGIVDGEPPTAEVDGLKVWRQLRGATPFSRPGVDETWSLLETSFWAQPRLRTLLLDRIDALLDGSFSRDGVASLLDGVYGPIESALAIDVTRCPRRLAPGEPSSVRDTLLRRYDAHTVALRAVVKSERSALAESLVIAEIAAAPAQGAPWIEVWNRSADEIDLSRWFVTDEPLSEAPRLALGDAVIPPDGRVVVGVPEADGVSLPPTGGKLFLYGPDGQLPHPKLVELVVYGRQSPGITYGRRAEDGAWSYLAKATPGEPNNAATLLPPPLASRHKVVEERSGDLTLTLLPRLPRRGGLGGATETKVDSVTLVYRESGADGWSEVPLQWERDRHRWSVRLEKNDDRPRTDYWFRLRSVDGIERAWPPVAPDLTLALVRPPALKINEVLPRPRREAGQREFIEIHNPGEEPVDLSGMFLTDDRSRPMRWRIPDGIVVPPEGYSVFWADGRDEGRHTNFSLSNSGEFLGLYGRLEEGNLRVDTVAFRGVSTGQSWGRTQDGTMSFRSWRDPTPGAKNVPQVPPEVLERLRREREKERAEASSPR